MRLRSAASRQPGSVRIRSSRSRTTRSVAQTGSVARLVDQLVLLDPRHHRAQPFADDLDLVRSEVAPLRLQHRRARAILQDELARVLAALDLVQDLLHLLLR